MKTADQRVILLGVPWSHYEVLLALRGEASVHVRSGASYARVERSSLLPDLELPARFPTEEDQTRAARGYLAALGGA